MKGRENSMPFESLRKWGAGILLFLLSLCWYRLTLLPTVGYIDSPIFTRKAFQLDLGVGSTDHPLFMTIGRIFIMSPFGGDPAFRLNLVSAFFGACTVLTLFLLVYEVLIHHVNAGFPAGIRRRGREGLSTDPSGNLSNEKIRGSGRIKRGSGGIALAASFITALAAITSHTLWWLSTEAEVYTLNSFFTLLILLLVLMFRRGRTWRTLYLASYLFGLGLANHQHPALFAPVLFLFLVITNRSRFLSGRRLAACLGWFTAGFSFYLLLVAWNIHDHGSLNTANAIAGGEFRSSLGISGGGLGRHALRFIFFLCAQVYFFHAVIVAGGLLRLRRRSRGLAAVLLALSAVNVIFVLLYDIPDRIFFYLPVFLFFFIFLAAGLEHLLKRAAAHSRLLLLIASFVLLLPALYKPVIYSFNVDFAKMLVTRGLVPEGGPNDPDQAEFVPMVPDTPGRDSFAYYLNPDKRNNYSARYYLELLEKFPPDAFLIDDWYHGYSIIQDYYQEVESRRTDVEVLRWFEVYGGSDEERARRFEQVRERLMEGRDIFLTSTDYPISTLLERLYAEPGYRIERKNGLIRLSAAH